MSKFLELNFTEFSIDQPGFLKILPTEAIARPTERNVCVCCLDTNGPFVKLGTCAHSGFVENIYDAARPDIQMMEVCRLCHGMLHKINMFKKQVEESIRRLREQAKNLVKDKSQLQSNRQINNLQHYNTTPLVIFSSIKVEIKIEPTEETTEYAENTEIVPEIIMSPTKTLKTEKLEAQTEFERINTQESQESVYLGAGPSIKMEVDIEEQDSDLETSLPLSEVRKEITAKSKNNSQVNNFAMINPTNQQQMFLISYTKSAFIEQKYEGKIREVILTLEELMSEREDALLKLKLPFKCLDCVIGFEFESKLEEHTRKTHMCKGEFQCEICKGRYTKSDIRLHYIRHYIRYECAKCNKRYKTSIAAFSHYSSHDDVKSIVASCKDCNMNFTNYRVFRHHRSKHNGPVSCEKCDKTFITKDGLKAHVLIHHNEDPRPRIYKCELCSKVYKEKQTWSRHMKSEHSDKRPYCDTCHVTFKSDHSLWCHLKCHSKHISEDDKRFVCDHCRKRFVTKQNLAEHVNWVHLKSTDHCCNICNKAFRYVRTLRRHIAFVHEKKKMPKNKICDHCGKGFSSAGVLRNHITIHTGARPHKCDICEATFAQNSALYNHRKLKHKIRPKRETVS